LGEIDEVELGLKGRTAVVTVFGLGYDQAWTKDCAKPLDRIGVGMRQTRHGVGAESSGW
jgi:hypothetical protein